MRSTAIDDFLERVVILASGCIEWTGALTRKGYAEFARPALKIKLGHRFAWFYFRDEPLRSDLVIDHLCRNKKCVNPYHMEQVTAEENTRRAAPNRPYCANGHLLTADNIYRRSDSRSRRCKICQNERCKQARREGRWLRNGVYPKPRKLRRNEKDHA